jgi:hypothetical protein
MANSRGVPMERICFFGTFYQPDIRQLADEKRLVCFPWGNLIGRKRENIKFFVP